MTACLDVSALTAGYGGFDAVRNVSLKARPGITALIGPNGAGKTTLLKAIAGLIGRCGEVRLDTRTLPSRDAVAVVRAGIALVPEGRQLFAQMTVRENLELGAWLVPRAERAARLARAFDDFPRLKERAGQLAGTMSGGEQQMVAVARALMSGPRLVMLDEPSLGLAPRMVDELLGIVRRIASQGVTVFLVEQNVRKALASADYAYVLERGAVAAEGPAREIAASDAVQRSYLGSA